MKELRVDGECVAENGLGRVLIAATHHIVTGSPLTSFYIIFALIAADTMMSCMTFFAAHERRITGSAAQQMGLLEKEGSFGGAGRLHQGW